MTALQYVDVPGYSALILRRTFADLAKPGAIMDRAREWLSGTDAKWNEQKHQWRFPSGAVLSFGHLDTENDKYAYQGAEYQFIGFDELTHFTLTQYTYMRSRLRRLGASSVPLRVRCGSNPGGEGHDWVYARFFTNAVQPGKPRRVFVPAKLEDNPHLDQESYRESLAELDPVTRRQLEHGDWAAMVAGEYFKRSWFKIVDHPPPPVARRVRYWDIAATEAKKGSKAKGPDWAVGLKLSEWQGDYYVEHVVRGRFGSAAMERELAAVALVDGPTVEVYVEQEPGSNSKLWIAHVQRNVLAGYAVYGRPQHKDKVTRARPVSAAASQGRIFFVRGPWNEALLDELVAFPLGSFDDQTDTLSGSYNEMHVTGGTDANEYPEQPVTVEWSGLAGEQR